MKKCPFCAELIEDSATECRFCEEKLPVKSKTPEKVKQDPAVIYATVFVILSTWIFYVIVGFLGKDFTGVLSIGIILDFFFAYHLLKMKNWARLWIIARSIFGLVLYGAISISQNDYFTLALQVAFAGGVLTLLFGKGSKLKAIIVSSAYTVFLLGYLVVVYMGLTDIAQTQQIIETKPIITEQESREGFKVILPSDKWRFLTKEDALQVIGNFAANSTINIVDTGGQVFGVFLGEDLSEYELNKEGMTAIADSAKKDYMTGHKIINEVIEDDGVFIESQYVSAGTEYVLLYAYLVLGDTGVTCYFSGELAPYNNLREETFKTLQNVQRISRKKYLPTVSSKEIFDKNSNAVALIRVYDEKGNIVAFSSGFNIREDGVIITNLHTLLSGVYVDVKFPYHGAYEEVFIAGLSQTGSDIVVLKVEGKDLPYVNLEDTMEIEIGDKVVVVSHPEGLINSLSEGIISGARELEGQYYYQMTAPISPGSSGGAVFNAFGNIIGISTASLEGGQNLNFCIPISEVSNIDILEQLVTLAQLQEFLKQEAK